MFYFISSPSFGFLLFCFINKLKFTESDIHLLIHLGKGILKDIKLQTKEMTILKENKRSQVLAYLFKNTLKLVLKHSDCHLTFEITRLIYGFVVFLVEFSS